MKILQLIFSLTSGGAEKFTVDLSNQLALSNEVYLVVILSDSNEVNSIFKNRIHKDVTYINLKQSSGFNVATFFTIFKLLIEIRPNVVHAHLNTVIYTYLPSFIFRNRIKFIHTLHNIATKTNRFKWQRRVNRHFYRKGLIQAVAISKECETSFIDFYHNDNVFLVENGVAIGNPTKNLVSTKKEVDNLKINDSDKVFIHIGKYSKQKNHMLLVEVFNKLLEEGNSLILIIIGDDFDSKDAQLLKEKSKKGIFYLGTRKNVSDYLLCSDAFVLSSLWEGLPISLLEALSCGIIPVCTPAGGIPNVLINDKYGYLSVDFTKQGLYDALIKCIEKMDHFDRSKLISFFNSNFSIEACAKNYEIIYEK